MQLPIILTAAVVIVLGFVVMRIVDKMRGF